MMKNRLIKIYLGIFLISALWKSVIQGSVGAGIFFLIAFFCLLRKPIKPLGYLLTIISALLLLVSLFAIAQQFYFGKDGLKGYFFPLLSAIAGFFGTVEYFAAAPADEKKN
jgi:hypothetical protein